ncbi:MAG: hypothetical protein KIS77_03760 [Saprospiraceae bacterium]|nr:hypothetical protein [Saprospiraceae bacterium]
MKNKMNLIDVIRQAVLTDEESSSKQVSWLEKAYQEGDCDALLIAICGYSMPTLREMANGKAGV